MLKCKMLRSFNSKLVSAFAQELLPHTQSTSASLKVRAFLCPQLHSLLMCSEYTSASFSPKHFYHFFAMRKKKILYYLTRCFFKATAGRPLPIPHLFREFSRLSRLFRRLNDLQTQQCAASQVTHFIYGIFIAACRLKT